MLHLGSKRLFAGQGCNIQQLNKPSMKTAIKKPMLFILDKVLGQECNGNL